VKDKATLIIGLVLFLLALSPASLRTAAAQLDRLVINGDGSTFAYPLYRKWIEEYEKANPGVQFTYVSNGSGAGIHDIMLGSVDFAGTDGPLTKTQLLDFATHRNCDVLHFPVAIGADVAIYNLPGVKELKFTPRALSGIYLGSVTKWNDPEITRPNPHVLLPGQEIVVVHRQDGSGTTYVWTDYLSKVSTDWRQRVGAGISVTWPVGIAAKGNEGVVQTVGRTPYSIGYAELTYAVRSPLFFGEVSNRTGRFIKANLASVTEAAAGVADTTPADFRVSITDPSGADAYRISSFKWMLVPSVITDGSKRYAIIKFIQWGLTEGQDQLEALSYARLPGAVITKEEKALGKIKSLGGSASAAHKGLLRGISKKTGGRADLF
jgi:phosphate transport system substrate-binding protein